MSGSESPKLDPKRLTYSFALIGVWKGNHTGDLKKATILQGMAKSTSSDEIEIMQFMVAALDDLSAQQTKIAELGRGNGLQKQLAAKRVLLLNQNPQTRISQ